MSNPRQGQADERQNQTKEADLFDHVRHHDEQADAADDNEREAIKQLSYGGGSLPKDGAQGPHQERQGGRQNQHEAHRFNPYQRWKPSLRHNLLHGSGEPLGC